VSSADPDEVRRRVLLIHGQPGRGSDWDDVVERLGSDLSVLAPDRPGYGNGGKLTSMAGNADVLAELLRTGGGTPAVVVGHSYGGGIALLLADRHPDVVAGLVLLASVGGSGSVLWIDRVLAAPIVGAVASISVLAVSTWISPRLRRRLSAMGGGSAQLLARYFPDERMVAGARGRSVWRAFVYEQRALVGESQAIGEAVSRLTLPSEVVVGTRDFIIPPRSGARLAAELDGSGLVLVAGAGHMLPSEAARVVAGVIERMAERVGSPGGGVPQA